jgi:ribosomal protein L7Ae-like RNA K-turn-binding protein
LLRFVLAPERELVPDLSHKLPGRGAYTCFTRECVERALRRRQFSRAFKGEVRLEGEAELVARIVQLQEERLLSRISLANRAGEVISGSDAVTETLRKGMPALLVLARDISPDSAARFTALAERAGIAVVPFATKEQLGMALGKELRSAVALMRGGLATRLHQELLQYRNFFKGGAE